MKSKKYTNLKLVSIFLGSTPTKIIITLLKSIWKGGYEKDRFVFCLFCFDWILLTFRWFSYILKSSRCCYVYFNWILSWWRNKLPNRLSWVTILQKRINRAYIKKSLRINGDFFVWILFTCLLFFFKSRSKNFWSRG